MSEDQKKQLEHQLWNIANTLRGKMNADEFRDYILGFIFYKYLSEKMFRYADSILKQDGLSQCLNKVDFEPELIHRDGINVNYIIQLLIKLKSKTQKEVTQIENEIFGLLSSEAQLRSKRELI